MATKKANKKETAAPAAKKETKKAPAAPAAKAKMTEEEKKAKRAARLEKIKARPAGQRPNSKQVDVIDLGNGSKVLNFGAPVRKVGTLVTSVAVDAEGNVTSTSVALIPGVTVRSKKGHGTFKYGAPGLGKGNDDDIDTDGGDDEENEEEEED